MYGRALSCIGEADARAGLCMDTGWLAGWFLVGLLCLSYRGLFPTCVWVDKVVFLQLLLVPTLCLIPSGLYIRHV